jgi:hypothetical protein
MSSGHHEDFERELPHQGPSDRKFGVVFAAVCLLLGLWPMLRERPARPLWLAISAVFLVACWLRPTILGPANRIWTRLGIVLGKLVNPIVTGLLFYVIFTPAALIIRWTGKDLLALARDEAADSYWIRRSSADLSGMVNQF